MDPSIPLELSISKGVMRALGLLVTGFMEGQERVDISYTVRKGIS